MLDDTPQTVERLSDRLDRDPEDVRELLEQARKEGLAVDWGDVWATTWRAKLAIAPGFFRFWVPASLALGAGLTATATALNAPPAIRRPLAGLMAALAIVATGLALVAWIRNDGSASAD